MCSPVKTPTRDDGRVRPLTVSPGPSQFRGLLDRRHRVGGAEAEGGVTLELHRVGGYDPGGAGVGGSLHRIDTDPADTHHDDDLAGLHLSRVDRRSPAGRYAATQEGGRQERDVVRNLYA